MKKWSLFALPLVLFVSLAVFLYQGLFSDPRSRPSSVVDTPLPPMDLPDLMFPEQRYSVTDFEGKVTLLNVWGVWCVTCAIELPYLTELRQQGVNIVGLYYDQDVDPDFGQKTLAEIQQEVRLKLNQLGNPYQYNIFDTYRDYSLDLGVTGAPETFVIDKTGHIRMHHIGDVNPRVWEHKIGPMYQRLLQE
ncbi:redoxin family protein [Aestuariibacter halophilus]|uniref:Redoxin family protein n=1 Tax=Fluctibacter halophilus TaxID=226011 RepID=A0ABS8G2J8_9ALTE|nr:redoxin family protein [Aestuariibacter halophilus]MCC2614795.1 redoxin family protein [Aestuariibacter halophilus]